MSDAASELAANAGRFRGSLEDYDQFRPSPPALLLDLLGQIANIHSLSHVVDLGCGTGLSTRFWSSKAQHVVGIDPSAQMIAVAQPKAPPNTTHTLGFSHETGLLSGAADVVSCCQSLHWMSPDATIREVERILRPGGVWLVADYDLPLLHWEIDRAIKTCIEKAKAKSAALKLHKEEKQWIGAQFEKIEASGQFRFAREFFVHATDRGDLTRLMGLLRSLATIQMPLQHCESESELGLDAVKSVAAHHMQGDSVEWVWSYRIILAVK